MMRLLTDSIRALSDTSYTVPGYPITELAGFSGSILAVNEKTAMEYALGDSLMGRRSVVIVKNVGVNALADPLVNATTQGLIGGVVLISGDDTEAEGSQNRQDTRPYSQVASIPLIELDASDVYGSLERAFRESERCSRVALMRVTDIQLKTGIKGQCIPAAPGDRKHGELAGRYLTMKGRAERADNLFKGENVEPETVQSRGCTKTLCKNCPFKPLFEYISEEGIDVILDTGCALLAMKDPYNIGLANYGLGSSVAVAARSAGIAITGDYALLHSGMNALADVYEKRLPLITVVLKNNRMGMTGGDTADITKYIGWANPQVFNDMSVLKESVVEPKTFIFEADCPEGEKHETIRY
ncbi:MAG: indolepyruvate ferredoxin oxidoreductase [Thermoplasmatales archaeon]|jgi:indolepyruvate ferredoxin oxidoreductase alpha subunit|nr:indolepyruvate ferredoxin oxidoreductase [Thermoplasmatales archaeon]